MISFNSFWWLFQLLWPFFQFGSMDAFGENPWQRSKSIDSSYVDGVSVTHGSPRQHIWSFAVGLSRTVNYPLYNCPCSQYPGPGPDAPFVGNDYFCESGNDLDVHNIAWSAGADHRLWDGSCDSKSNCCNRSGMPYFTKVLPRATSDDLEVRLCTNENTYSENVGLEKLELFIRWSSESCCR